ncbi:hypothetical protein HZH68_016150 [Vespula germanica]|uniref:Uncharacterized protein n=1 Tax=Vespula germanica TaxID=30212 RepID=A0A834MQS2_VESGE|nr:hypothetical protein HZH68_016150 [Vespula germanica]
MKLLLEEGKGNISISRRELNKLTQLFEHTKCKFTESIFGIYTGIIAICQQNSIPFSCIVANLYPVSEFRNRCISIIKLKCCICGLINHIETDNTSEKDFNVNTYMVSGIISTCREHLQLEELCIAIKLFSMIGLMSEAAEEGASIACLKAVDHIAFLKSPRRRG